MSESKNPALIIQLSKIRHNAQVVTALCQRYGIMVTAVTKGFCAIPEVAEAMLQGGCSMVADSRVKNLQKLREFAFDVEYMLLRMPMLSETDEVVRCADISLNSEIATIQALNAAAKRAHARHKVVLMVDIGDLREGVWPDQLGKTVEAILACEYIHFEGIGTNLGCYGGVIPSPTNMQFLVEQKEWIETHFSVPVPLISGGSTSGLQLLVQGGMPPGVNHFRVGEGILLGRSTTDRFLIPGTFQDTFRIRGEVIECNEKPSVPIGERGLDAFGNIPQFADRGLRRRVIVALGRQDVVRTDGLAPFDETLVMLGATSDHLLVDTTESPYPYRVGDTVEFSLDYTSLLAAATSEYVVKELV